MATPIDPAVHDGEVYAGTTVFGHPGYHRGPRTAENVADMDAAVETTPEAMLETAASTAENLCPAVWQLDGFQGT